MLQFDSIKTITLLGNISKLLANIVFLFSLFPYLTILRTPWDVQPFALMFAFAYMMLMFVALNRLSLPIPWIMITLGVLYGLCLSSVYAMFGQVDIDVMVRRAAAYATMSTVALVSIREHHNVWSGWLVIAVLTWSTIAFMQTILGVDFISVLLPRVSTSVQRGVISLAPEPSYCAVQGILFLILNEIFRKENRYPLSMYLLLLCLCFFQIFLSLSGTALVLSVVFIIGKILSIRNIKWRTFLLIICLMASLLTFTVSFIKLSDNTRIGVVMNMFKYILTGRASFTILLTDRSISYRMVNPVLGFYGGLVVSKGIGFGWGRITETRFPQWLIALLGPYRYSGGVPIGEWKFGGTIMGGIVSAVYELGIIGLLCCIVMISMIFRSLVMEKINYAILFPLLILMFGGFISLAHPLIGYLLGFCTCVTIKDKKYRNNASK